MRVRLCAPLGLLSLAIATATPAQSTPVQSAPGRSAPARQPAGTPGASTETGYFEFLRGRHLEAQGQLAEALAAYERAALADQGSAQIRAEIAALYARQSRTDDAVREARRALAINPDNTEANWILGALLATAIEARREEAGAAGASAAPADTATSVETAIAHLERARPGRPFDNALLLTLGRLQLTRRAWGDAIEVLTSLVDREPDSPEARYLLAQAYDGSGQLARAVDTLEAAADDRAAVRPGSARHRGPPRAPAQLGCRRRRLRAGLGGAA